MTKSPHHLAIIMDGNRRWARQRGMPALYGHQRGAETLKAVTRHAHGRGIRWLTAFAFSFENWSRPKPEVDGLLGLLRGFLENDVGVLNEENVKLRVIGNRSRFTSRLGELIDWAEHETAANTGINLTLALDYGGRQDITSAARKLANEVANGMLSPGDINEDMLKSRMGSAALPDIDLLIRTGGEQRVSNFMLWDMSYAELHFASSFWPDFSLGDLDLALNDFAGRERRFGGDGIDEINETVTSLADKRRLS